MRYFPYIRITFLFVAIIVTTGNINSQKVKVEGLAGKADLYKSKNDALAYLNDNEVIKKYGGISDAIWNYAELAMQEFKSSALLIKTLEEEGFSVEKGVAGMPTCFVASWGSGKPVIGILGEFDALPMLSQKALSPVQIPVVAGAPGHGCGHNMMGTAGNHPYKSFLPEGAKPPLDLNKALMEKFRDEMSEQSEMR